MFRGQGNDGFEIEAGEEGHLRRSGTGGAVDAWFDYGEEGRDLNEGLGGGFVCHGSLRGGQGSSMYVCCCGEEARHRWRRSGRIGTVATRGALMVTIFIIHDGWRRRGRAAQAGPRSGGRGCVP